VSVAYAFVTRPNTGKFEDRLKCNDLLYKFQQLYWQLKNTIQ